MVVDEIRLQIHRYPLTRYLQRQWVSVGFRQVDNSIVPIASLDPKAPRWLWDEYLLRGGINLIVGAKGVGKTSLVCWLAARASLGVERFGGTPLRVFIDTQEDDPEVVAQAILELGNLDGDRRTLTCPHTVINCSHDVAIFQGSRRVLEQAQPPAPRARR